MEKLISEILYELQPFRMEDVRIMWNYCQESLNILRNEFLNRDEFIKSLELQGPSERAMLWGGGWVIGYMISIWMKVGSIYFIFTVIIGIFLNLGVKQRGESSAYSVFNQGYERILGTMTADQFEREIRHDDHFGEEEDERGEFLIEDENEMEGRAPRQEKKNKNTYRKKGKKSHRN